MLEYSFSRPLPKLVALSRNNRVVASVDAASQENNFWHIDPSYWAHIVGQSIDYAILERCDGIKCLKFAGCWSDLGDWNALASQLPLDTSENLISGEVTQFDCNNTTLWAVSKEHLVGLGLKNIVAVVTDDAVLVADANCVQDVRYAVDCLAEKRSYKQVSITYYRPWGWFENLVNKPGYQVKRLFIQKPPYHYEVISIDLNIGLWFVGSK